MRRTGCDLVLIGLLLFVSGCGKQVESRELELELSSAEQSWLGEQVFRNECASRAACLVHWNEGEAFPSLGIGHFIWYPTGVNGPFVESFPAMIDHLMGSGVELPHWVARLDPFDAPWANRDEFLRAGDDPEIRELRGFLAATRDQQAGFLSGRALKALDRVLGAAPEPERGRLYGRLQALVGTPGGVYAVVDYVNFKGEGLAASERYDDQGWGLLQVLQAMDDRAGKTVLQAFRESAVIVLTRRADNADKAIERERWLPGWLNRLETYREPD
jgi:hypothetical protein